MILRVPVAVAEIFDLVREVNVLCDSQSISQNEAEQVLSFLRKFDSVLGVLNFEKAESEIPHELQSALNKRIEARKIRTGHSPML